MVPSAEDSEEESVEELLEDSLIDESLEESLDESSDESEEEFSDKELSEILSDDTEPFCEESDEFPPQAATDIVSAAHIQTARAISSFLLLFFLITYYVPPYSLISQPLFYIFLAFEKYGKKNINSFYPIDIKIL
jgi:hypothetical protein